MLIPPWAELVDGIWLFGGYDYDNEPEPEIEEEETDDDSD